MFGLSPETTAVVLFQAAIVLAILAVYVVGRLLQKPRGDDEPIFAPLVGR